MNLVNHMFTASSRLLQWFAHHSSRNSSQITTACRSLALNYDIDPQRSFYLIFLPLVRIGMIEFVGNGVYQLAASIILQHMGVSSLTAINPSVTAKNYIKNNYYSSEPLYNLVRFQCTSEQLTELVKLHPMPVVQDDITNLLTQFPDIQSVIKRFPTERNFAGKKLFYDPFRLSITTEVFPFGIYKESETAQIHYFQDKDQQVYQLPPRQINPEIFSIACCYQLSIMKRLDIRYDRTEQRLYVPRVLPSLLERVLRIPSFSTCESWPTTQEEKMCFLNITDRQLESVKRILYLNS